MKKTNVLLLISLVMFIIGIGSCNFVFTQSGNNGFDAIIPSLIGFFFIIIAIIVLGITALSNLIFTSKTQKIDPNILDDGVLNKELFVKANSKFWRILLICTGTTTFLSMSQYFEETSIFFFEIAILALKIFLIAFLIQKIKKGKFWPWKILIILISLLMIQSLWFVGLPSFEIESLFDFLLFAMPIGCYYSLNLLLKDPDIAEYMSSIMENPSNKSQQN